MRCALRQAWTATLPQPAAGLRVWTAVCVRHSPGNGNQECSISQRARRPRATQNAVYAAPGVQRPAGQSASPEAMTCWQLGWVATLLTEPEWPAKTPTAAARPASHRRTVSSPEAVRMHASSCRHASLSNWKVQGRGCLTGQCCLLSSDTCSRAAMAGCCGFGMLRCPVKQLLCV